MGMLNRQLRSTGWSHRAAVLAALLVAALAARATHAEEPKAPAGGKPATTGKTQPPREIFHAERGATSVFGIAGEGSRFVYVFDRSGSMDDPGGYPLRAAKKELLTSLGQLDDICQFYIIFYNDEPRAFEAPTGHGKLVFANEANKKSAEGFVEGIHAEGGTNHFDALLLAVKLHPDVIFLLTDGEDKDGLTGEQLERLRTLNDGTAAIKVIQFTHGPAGPEPSLARLAKDNRGEHRIIDISKRGREQ